MILVCGGAGFIGSHLADRLLSLGHKVTIIDDLSTGSLDNLDLFFKTKPYKNGVFYQGTVIDNLDTFDIEKIDYVFHLAANTNVPLSVEDPLFDFKTLLNSVYLIDMCARLNIPLFYVSSSFIYGNAKRPTKETEPFQVSAPYGITKFTTEKYLEFYHEVYGLRYTVVRPATVYGPRQVKGAMADYIRQLKAGKQAVIYGSKTRDYLYVSDLIDALILLMGKEGTYNVGTGKETSLESLYLDLAYLLNKKTDPIFEKERPGEVKHQSLNCSKLRKLGWKPKIKLIQGLELCLKEN